MPSERAEQPTLDPDRVWPQRTREWWEMWGRSPLTAEFTASDWSSLSDTALLHAVVWSATPGSSAFFKAMSQLRQRTAAFGATPTDRARLRIQFAFAEQAKQKAAPATGARARRGPLLHDDA